jgi:hypothetical protein
LTVKKNPIVKTKKTRQSQWSYSTNGSRNWYTTNEIISVGRKAFTAHSKLPFGNLSGYSFSQTCKFVVNSGKVKITYALPDNSGLANVKITAYLDGEPVFSISISRGEVDTLDVNTSGFKSMAIEVTANSNKGSDGDYFYAVIE